LRGVTIKVFIQLDKYWWMYMNMVGQLPLKKVSIRLQKFIVSESKAMF